MKKKLLWLCIAAMIIIVSLFLPDIGPLTAAGMRTVALLVVFLIMLITEALPVAIITCIPLDINFLKHFIVRSPKIAFGINKVPSRSTASAFINFGSKFLFIYGSISVVIKVINGI